MGGVRLIFEELTTILTQIEACLNSRPLTPLPHPEDEFEARTPGHFLVGAPLEALPDTESSTTSISLLWRWHLCQALVRHFWQHWSTEYLTNFQKLSRWLVPSHNLRVDDIVCLCNDPMAPTKWPLARVVKVHPGGDGRVQVVTVRAMKGIYKCPIVKVVPSIINLD